MKTGEKRIYDIWHNIVFRCNNEKYPTYLQCSVCDEWKTFENFKQWYTDHYYKIGREKMCVDKDILYKHNTIYSPRTCCIVPETINMLFTNRQRFRGSLPVGVTLKNGKYIAKCKIDSKDRYIGSFNTSIEAFEAYKSVKEEYIKAVSEKYKLLIPIDVYKALISYKVSIDD